MIVDFADKDTERVFRRERCKRWQKALAKMANRKLLILHAASDLKEVAIPPSNRLEKLSGDREGQYSIRVNDRWRICFAWRDGNAFAVEMVDYH